MIGIIGSVVSGLFGLGGDYLKKKREEAQAVHERKLTQIKNDANWDTIQAENAGNSWKDEFALVVLMSPFISMFFSAVVGWDGVVERHKEAFLILKNEVPSEYWYLLAVAVAASFGIKKVVDGVMKLRGK